VPFSPRFITGLWCSRTGAMRMSVVSPSVVSWEDGIGLVEESLPVLRKAWWRR
jgi:hypothetical protein